MARNDNATRTYLEYIFYFTRFLLPFLLSHEISHGSDAPAPPSREPNARPPEARFFCSGKKPRTREKEMVKEIQAVLKEPPVHAREREGKGDPSGDIGW
jgi:hypothetical protein